MRFIYFFLTPEQIEVHMVVIPASSLWTVYFNPDLI